MPSISRKQKNQKALLKTRYVFLVYVTLLAISLINFLGFTNRDFLSYELGITGIAYLASVYFVLRQLTLHDRTEVIVYFIAHLVVGLCVLFFYLTDK